MRPTNQLLVTWIRRAAPNSTVLRKALMASCASNTAGMLLSIGSLGLLFASNGRPTLRSVAIGLVFIEMLSFVRSPLRFAERIRTHNLGFQAVTTWRGWLTSTVAAWPARRLSTARTGDLLERALGDADELQELWVRAVVPVVGVLAATALIDLALALLAPVPRFLVVGICLLVVQIVGVALQWRTVEHLVNVDAQRRLARANFREVTLEAQNLGAELKALGHPDVLQIRIDTLARDLAQSERAVAQSQRIGPLLAMATTVVAVAVVTLTLPPASRLQQALAVLVALATSESLAVIHAGITTVVRVIAAAQRLDELATEPGPHATWNGDPTFMCDNVVVNTPVSVVIGNRRVVSAGRRIAITGASGVGKSTLLRVLAGLDAPDQGRVVLGDSDVDRLRDDGRPLTYVPTDPGFLDGLLFDAVRLGRIPTRDISADLAAVGLPSDQTTRVAGWSRGQGQRLAVVRALATSPAVVVLDEPTSGLGPDETNAVLALLASSGATVIVATHDERVVTWCDEVWNLS